MKLTFTILPWASFAFAFPNGTPPTKSSVSKMTTPSNSSCSNITSYTASFDDYPTSPSNLSVPIPYQGLLFQGFATITPDEMDPTIVPYSPPSFVATNAQFEMSQGSAEWTVLYPNSKVKSFSLESFFFGCVLSDGTEVMAPPMACNIAITAYRSGDNTAQMVQVGAQGFSYLPTTSLGPQQMAPGDFSEVFQDIQYVLVQWSPTDSAIANRQPDFAVTFDDIKYTVCYES